MGIGVIGAASSTGSLPVGASAKRLEVNAKGFQSKGNSITPGTYLAKADSWYSSAPVHIVDNLGNRYLVKGEQKVTFPAGVSSIDFYAGVTDNVHFAPPSTPHGNTAIGIYGNTSSTHSNPSIRALKKAGEFYSGNTYFEQNGSGYTVAVVSRDGENWTYGRMTANTSSNPSIYLDQDKSSRTAGYFASGNGAYITVKVTSTGSSVGTYVGPSNTMPVYLTSTLDIFPNVAAIFTSNQNGLIYYSDATGSSWSSFGPTGEAIYGLKRSANGVVAFSSNGYVHKTSNGSSWSSSQLPNASTLIKAEYNGSMWMFLDVSNQNYWTTTDLVTFTQRAMPSSSRSYAAVLFWSKGDNLWYRVNDNEAFTSPDGINWTQMSTEQFLAYTQVPGDTSYINKTTHSYNMGLIVDTADKTAYDEAFFRTTGNLQQSGHYRLTSGFTVGIYELESAV